MIFLKVHTVIYNDSEEMHIKSPTFLSYGTKKQSNQTCLVDISGASIFSSIAWHITSSGIRTPTFFLEAYFAVVVPYLMHCLGNSLLADKMKVYYNKK